MKIDGKTTSEFKSISVFLLMLFGIYFFATDFFVWGWSGTILLSAYCLSRSLFKKDRVIMADKNSYLSTEFLACSLWIMFLSFAAFQKNLSLEWAGLFSSITIGFYSLGRGYAKSLTDTKVKFLR